MRIVRTAAPIIAAFLLVTVYCHDGRSAAQGSTIDETKIIRAFLNKTKSPETNANTVLTTPDLHITLLDYGTTSSYEVYSPLEGKYWSIKDVSTASLVLIDLTPNKGSLLWLILEVKNKTNVGKIIKGNSFRFMDFEGSPLILGALGFGAKATPISAFGDEERKAAMAKSYRLKGNEVVEIVFIFLTPQKGDSFIIKLNI